MLAGLEEIHAAGMVHGDIRPEVVVVTAQGQVRIGSLGLAAVLAANSTMGAWPSVAPPEGGAPSVAADLYAAGVLLQQLVSGLEAGVGQWAGPARLGVLVARATATAPQERFQSAAEFRGELERTAAALLGQEWRNQSELAARVARPLGPPQSRPGRGRFGGVLRSPAPEPVAVATAPTLAATALSDARPAAIAADAAPPAPPTPGALPAPPTSPEAVTPRPSPTPPPPRLDAGSWTVPAGDGGRPTGPTRSSFPSLPWSPRRRRRRMLLLALLGLVVILAVAFVLVNLKPFTASPVTQGPLTLGSAVSLTSQPPGTAGCNSGFTMVATGTTSGHGTMTYRWEQSQNGGPVTYDQWSVPIRNDSSFRLTEQLSFAGKATISTTVSFVILSPQSRSATRTVTYQCNQ